MNEVVKWYEQLTPESVREITKYYTDDAFFKDPFNELNGVGNIQKIFEHMFDNLESPRFIFIDKIEGPQSMFLTWDFKFSLKSREFSIHGSSHLKFDDSNKINYHRDYWDVGEELLMHIPVIKKIYSMFRSKLAIH